MPEIVWSGTTTNHMSTNNRTDVGCEAEIIAAAPTSIGARVGRVVLALVEATTPPEGADNTVCETGGEGIRDGYAKAVGMRDSGMVNGKRVGRRLGTLVGADEGAAVGVFDGHLEGARVGCDLLYAFGLVGPSVGDSDGDAEGTRVGVKLGVRVG